MSKKQLPDTKITKAEEDWMTKKWRPMMAIMYMTACLFDFVFFPIMFTIVQFWETAVQNDAFRQWAPITLQGGGLFHVAMGAVLGVSAWSRGQEKMAGVSGGSNALQPVSQSVTTTFGAPSTNFNSAPNSFGAPTPAANGWGSPPTSSTAGFGAAPVSTGFGGKLAPPQPDFYPER